MAIPTHTLKMQGVVYDRAIKKLFKHTLAVDLATTDLKLILHSASASDVMKLLIASHTSSVPVVGDDQRPIGFVDVIDLTAFILSCMTVRHKSQTNYKRKFHFNDSKWKMATARDLINFSHRNPFITVREDADLTRVIKALISAGSGHRCLVMSHDGSMRGVVTQSDLVRLFFKKIDDYEIAKKTVKELRFGYCEVNRILVSDLAYDGFERLIRRNVSGLAVVNDDGHTLYGNFSASNIKNLGERVSKSWDRLRLPVSQFLEEHSTLQNPIFILQSDTLSEVGRKFSESRAHRLFVADHPERMNLIGVISLSDVIRMLHISASRKGQPGRSGSKRESPKRSKSKSPVLSEESHHKKHAENEAAQSNREEKQPRGDP